MKRTLCLLAVALLFTACVNNNECKVSIGDATFQCDPNSAAYSGLNHVGGYEYFTGGHRGVVVVRLSLTEFMAFERTCPCDNDSRVVVSSDYGAQVLECPTCHTLFSTNNYGNPMDGAATRCPLYQYSTRYTGGILYVY